MDQLVKITIGMADHQSLKFARMINIARIMTGGISIEQIHLSASYARKAQAASNTIGINGHQCTDSPTNANKERESYLKKVKLPHQEFQLLKCNHYHEHLNQQRAVPVQTAKNPLLTHLSVIVRTCMRVKGWIWCEWQQCAKCKTTSSKCSNKSSWQITISCSSNRTKGLLPTMSIFKLKFMRIVQVDRQCKMQSHINQHWGTRILGQTASKLSIKPISPKVWLETLHKHRIWKSQSNLYNTSKTIKVSISLLRSSQTNLVVIIRPTGNLLNK